MDHGPIGKGMNNRDIYSEATTRIGPATSCADPKEGSFVAADGSAAQAIFSTVYEGGRYGGSFGVVYEWLKPETAIHPRGGHGGLHLETDGPVSDRAD